VTNWAEKLRRDLDQLANDFVDRSEGRRNSGVRRNGPGQHIARSMMAKYFIPTRRTCWAYVQAQAPIDVKQVIWTHEEDELISDKKMGGKAHVDMYPARAMEPLPGVRAACYAWIYIAAHRPWLQGLAASHILERVNDPSIIKGGTSIQRAAKVLMAEGVKFEDLPESTRAHLEADVDHSNLVWDVFARYVVDETTYRLVMEGARESLDCSETYRTAVEQAMLEGQQQDGIAAGVES
jgi:hypothetical protein